MKGHHGYVVILPTPQVKEVALSATAGAVAFRSVAKATPGIDGV